MPPRAALAAALALGLAAACDTVGFPVVRCPAIPEGGCPATSSTDLTPCSDGACAARYVCRAGSWERVAECAPIADAGFDAPSHDGGARLDASGYEAGSSAGCPPLQEPDCTVEVALACGSGCCACEDVFVCVAGGWQGWGACVEGKLVSSP